MDSWNYSQQVECIIRSSTPLLDQIKDIIVAFAFELDLFYHFHDIFKRTSRGFHWARPSYPFKSKKFQSVSYGEHKDTQYEILIGDICGIYIQREISRTYYAWSFGKMGRCQLLESIITSKPIYFESPDGHSDIIASDMSKESRVCLVRKIVPWICAHAARHRV